jgi:hypothetical protein
MNIYIVWENDFDRDNYTSKWSVSLDLDCALKELRK